MIHNIFGINRLTHLETSREYQIVDIIKKIDGHVTKYGSPVKCRVNLLNNDMQLLYSTVTDNTGYYRFDYSVCCYEDDRFIIVVQDNEGNDEKNAKISINVKPI